MNLWLLLLCCAVIGLAAFALMSSAFAAESRNPFDYSVLTYIWVLSLSAFGGIVNFSRKLRDGTTTRFRLTEFIGEVVTSSFAGLMTFWLCEAAGIDKLVAAVCIAVSGHMGSRAVFKIERWMEQRVGGGAAPAEAPDLEPEK